MSSQSEVNIKQFVINHDENALVDGKTLSVGYLWGGQEVAADHPDALAKKVTDPASGRVQFWVRRAASGPDAGHLYNPHSPFFDGLTPSRAIQYKGQSRYEFVKASPDCFDAYLRFLKTDSLLHLRQAERE